MLETELTAAGVLHDLKVYPAAKHSFFNDQWRNYQPVAASDSWQRVLASSPNMSGAARRAQASVRAWPGEHLPDLAGRSALLHPAVLGESVGNGAATAPLPLPGD